MPRVHYSGPAVRDIAGIGARIAADNERISRDFVLRIKEKCKTIAQAPLMGRQRDEIDAEVRSFPFGSYLIFYRPTETGITVARVLHGARNLPEAFLSE
ncbi:MAG: type II toxin-antitoxin system RelE/ParE family toxin [Alphaproteobacteria bacterium]|nr:type II toxin-antitoxin system RelE/ParE family toxin [Alphaproteobacteria bacterium]